MKITRKHYRLAVALASIGLVSAVAVSVSGAHIQDAQNRWFFSGNTKNSSGSRVDPITVLFKGADLNVNHNEMITSFQGTDRGDMKQNVCLGQIGGKQFVTFKSYRAGQSPIDDETDYEYGTSSTCRTQYHARIWDSTEHDQQFADRPDHNDDTFALVAVHRETRNVCCENHRLIRNWEHAERETVEQLAEFCSYRNWRSLPGSGPGKIQRWYSNGRVSRISPQRNQPNVNDCP